MARDNARILVIGAGVNGSVCAAWLFERGVDVTVLARGKRLAEIQSNGIVIENAFSQKRTVARVRAIGELAPGDTYDYILVVVRRDQVAELLPTLAANNSPNVVFMNNNLADPGEIVAALGTQRPMLGFVFAGGKRDGEIIRAIGPFHRSLMPTPFGEIDGTVTPRLKRLVNLLNRAGLRAKVSTHVVDYLATHAAGVAAFAPLALKHKADLKALAHSAQDVQLAAAALRQTFPVLKALGHKIVPASQQIVGEVLSAWTGYPGGQDAERRNLHRALVELFVGKARDRSDARPGLEQAAHVPTRIQVITLGVGLRRDSGRQAIQPDERRSSNRFQNVVVTRRRPA